MKITFGLWFGLANGGLSSTHCLDQIHSKMLQEINKSFENLDYIKYERYFISSHVI